MAGNTSYHRLPEENRPSLESTGDDEQLLDPSDDSPDDDPISPKQKQFKYSFHPTLVFRFVSSVLYLSAAITFIVSGRRDTTIVAAVFCFIALGRHILVLLHHALTRFIRVRIRIELSGSGSSITTKPKNKTPSWLLPGIISVVIDLVLAIVALSTTAAVSQWSSWYYGDVLGGKVVAFIAVGLHIISAADLGEPSRIIITGNFIFDKKDGDDNDDGHPHPPQLPIYRDVEATGAGEAAVKSRKTRADSPPVII